MLYSEYYFFLSLPIVFIVFFAETSSALDCNQQYISTIESDFIDPPPSTRGTALMFIGFYEKVLRLHRSKYHISEYEKSVYTMKVLRNRIESRVKSLPTLPCEYDKESLIGYNYYIELIVEAMLEQQIVERSKAKCARILLSCELSQFAQD